MTVDKDIMEFERKKALETEKVMDFWAPIYAEIQTSTTCRDRMSPNTGCKRYMLKSGAE
jgi:hypothetical protein